jgi:hypothetical protein
MNLTICLLTKGREIYLSRILDSFEGLFQFSFVKFLIYDNGSNNKCELILREWANINSLRVKYIRVEKNESRFSISWKTIKDNVEDWIIFPGDDDEFNWEIIEEWEQAINTNPNIVAFAASAEVINEKSERSGILLKPDIGESSDKVYTVAKAIHYPPFHWPSLFFRASKISFRIPDSRFVCDWWIGINLLMSGEVVTTNSPAIRYRRHSDQESFLAPLKRKNFEAVIWIGDLLRSLDFKNWLENLSDFEKIIFWKHIRTYLPIYGDNIFGNILLAELFCIIRKSLNNTLFIEEITHDFAMHNGVLLIDTATKNLIPHTDINGKSNFSNFSIEKNTNYCSKIHLAISEINYRPNSPNFTIYCRHSSRLKNGIKIDCTKLKVDDTDFNLDFIVNSITISLEKSGYFNFSITPKERSLISHVRKFKSFLPSNFLKLIGLIK